MSVENCPNCGARGTQCTIYKCDDCGKIFCSQCPETTVEKNGYSRGSNQCPKCGCHNGNKVLN